jgi:hypothetical protein
LGCLFQKHPLAKALKERNNYDIHLISVELTKKDATRAIKRFNKTKRYVPLGLIFDQYGNDSHLCYYYLRCKYLMYLEALER